MNELLFTYSYSRAKGTGGWYGDVIYVDESCNFNNLRYSKKYFRRHETVVSNRRGSKTYNGCGKVNNHSASNGILVPIIKSKGLYLYSDVEKARSLKSIEETLSWKVTGKISYRKGYYAKSKHFILTIERIELIGGINREVLVSFGK